EKSWDRLITNINIHNKDRVSTGGHRCFSNCQNSSNQVKHSDLDNTVRDKQDDREDAQNVQDRVRETESGGEAQHKEKVRLLQDIREDIMTVPNLLTTSRMLASPLLGGLVLYECYSWALGLFVLAGITDMLDGYIARNYKNQTSVLGTALDPLADKLLISILMVTLTMVELIPLPLAVLIVGRDVGLVAVGFYLRYISLPPPRTVSRYFDVRYPTAELHPSTISKINTAVQLSLVTLTLAAPVFNYVNHIGLQGLWYLTAATTFLSGVGYVFTRNSNVKILQAELKRKK
ncbi:hypothetical protein ScPMuIL_014468, partial [Solemya velum]